MFRFFKKNKESIKKNQSKEIDCKKKNNSSVADLICHKILLGRSTIELIRDSILNSSEQLKKQITNIDDLRYQNENARDSLNDLVEFISQITSAPDSANENLSNLDISIGEINSCIKTIQTIAEQTNIIAINSSIEAARVGNSGRGFNVISQEIKRLSGDVQCSSLSVQKTTKAMLNNIESMNCMLTKQDAIASSTQQSINKTVDSIKIIIDKSTEIRNILDNMSTIQFLNTVKIDHVLWKLEVYNLILNKKYDAKITTHDKCRLGKWYYNCSQNHLSKIDSFLAIALPHKEVHESGYSALMESSKGNLDKMSKELDKMEDSSNKVILNIERLTKDLGDGHVFNM